MKQRNKILTYVVIVLAAFICALNYTVFVLPNRFAPAGINGICTMFQHITGLNMGYLSLLLNIPLAIAVYFCVSKTLAVRAFTYAALFSGFLLVVSSGTCRN